MPYRSLFSDVQLKVISYMVMSHFEDAYTQRRGCVSIGWWLGKYESSNWDYEHWNEYNQSSQWLPQRITNAFHLCINDSPSKEIVARTHLAISSKAENVVTKLHRGTAKEVIVVFVVVVVVLSLTKCIQI